MQESDTYLAIIDEGQEKHAKKAILLVGGNRLGPPTESVKAQLNGISDLGCDHGFGHYTSVAEIIGATTPADGPSL